MITLKKSGFPDKLLIFRNDYMVGIINKNPDETWVAGYFEDRANGNTPEEAAELLISKRLFSGQWCGDE